MTTNRSLHTQPMETLHRKGAWLIAPKAQWKMASVHGPIAIDGDEREYFRVETVCQQVLLISRRVGEKGMRELRLDSFITPLPREDRGPFTIPEERLTLSRQPHPIHSREERTLSNRNDAQKTAS